MQLENPKRERKRAEVTQAQGSDEARLLAQFYRGVERQSKFDADVAAALIPC